MDKLQTAIEAQVERNLKEIVAALVAPPSMLSIIEIDTRMTTARNLALAALRALRETSSE